MHKIPSSMHNYSNLDKFYFVIKREILYFEGSNNIKRIFMKKVIVVFALLFATFNAFGQDGGLKARLEKHVYTLAADSMLGRSAGSDDSRRAAEYIIDNFKEIGLKPFVGDSTYRQKFSLSSGSRIFTNIIGYIEGNDPILKNEYIVIGAHYDHLGHRIVGANTIIYSGADDNASGTATMIEIARMIKQQEGLLRRTVIFAAFDAEEIGLYGSNHMVSLMDLDKVKFMASIDMVGWLRATGKLAVAGVAMLDNGNSLINNIPVPWGLKVETKNFDKMLAGGSDHDSFAEKGVPAFYITTGLKSPYHKPEDTAEKIDYDGMVLIAEYLAGMTEEFAMTDKLETSGKISSKHKLPNWEFAVTGSIGSTAHRYTQGALTGKSSFSWNAGLWLQRNISSFALRAEVLYHNRAARYPDAGDALSKSYRRLTMQSVTVPLNIMLKFPGESSTYFYINAGGYYSYNFAGKLGGAALDFDKDATRHEYGWTWGLGMSMGSIGMAYTSYHGISPVMPHGTKMKNESSYFTMFYRF